ncbi:hypothetical protein J7M00_08620, partial [bacterium]|nr:hypothetical protein [bacterium]
SRMDEAEELADAMKGRTILTGRIREWQISLSASIFRRQLVQLKISPDFLNQNLLREATIKRMRIRVSISVLE